MREIQRRNFYKANSLSLKEVKRLAEDGNDVVNLAVERGRQFHGQIQYNRITESRYKPNIKIVSAHFIDSNMGKFSKMEAQRRCNEVRFWRRNHSLEVCESFNTF